MPKSEEFTEADGGALLLTIAEYVGAGGRIKQGETFGYGYWHVRFEMDSRGRLLIHEPTAAANGYQPGAALAIRHFRDQTAMCTAFGVEFAPPRPDQLAAVSPGVLEGMPLEAVRYRAPSHMSGWYLSTAQYDGDIRSIRVEHLFHVTARRPDIAPYLALPPGFRFWSDDRTSVRFDEIVAAASP